MNQWGKDLARSSLVYWTEKPRVLEVGSLNVQEKPAGSIREDVQSFAGEYTGIDIRAGVDVDMVLPAENIIERYGTESFDVIMSTEMLEHARNWAVVLYNMIMAIKKDGLLVLTTRSPGFGRHEYPSDYWRFSIKDFKEIFEPIGNILDLESDNSGFPGVGIIFRKTIEFTDATQSKNFLESLKRKKILNIDYGECDAYEFETHVRSHSTTPQTIALVMIVKNEAKILERCIESVKAIVDEFVIVDTGSTDGTQEIIKKYGTLYEIPFTNYVDTKNNALKLAKSDYILFMDADEYVVSGLQFLKEHAQTGAQCVQCNIVEGADDNYSQVYLRSRLWKNDGTWRFDGPGVHETLVGGVPYIDYRINVKHDHSHRTAESYANRYPEYVRMLSDALVKNPKDARALFYMGRTHKDAGNYLEAITYFKRYLNANTNFRDERWQAAYDIASCWKSQGEYDKSLIACDLTDEIDPRRSESFFLRASIYYDLFEFDEAIKWFEKAANTPVPNDVVLFLNPRAHKDLPLDYLTLCYDITKRYRLGKEVTRKEISLLRKPDQRVVNNLAWLTKMADRTIFFALGHTPEMVYGGMIEKQGVGGVETTYLELPDELAKLGHNVFVFCRCEKAHSYNGVYFIPYTEIENYANLKPDVIITSRWYDPLYAFPKAKKIIWMQDAHFADPNHADAWQVCDAVICSSRWHRQYIAERLGQGLDGKKIHIVPLGIRKELFQDKHIVRDPLKVIYSSNPDRGLYILADIWNEISKEIKGIHLTITYGWEGLRTWSSDAGWLQKIDNDKKQVEDWMAKAGNVSLTGRLTKSRLAEEMLSSTLCLYPNNFWETFCLTALETQAAGTPMITTGIGALKTTLDNRANVLIEDNPYSLEYRKKFLTAVFYLMDNREKINILSDRCISHFNQQPDWGDIAKQWENIIYKL
jgi:glycosyltransferase involved in cell wall biosynthesis